MGNKQAILERLHEMGIPYHLVEHRPYWTMEDCLGMPEIDPEKATMPKNVFLCNRQQTVFYLLLLSPQRAYRTAVVSKLLGVSRLSFAPEERLPLLLGLEKGAVSPLGLMFDRGKQVTLVVDDALLQYERLWFHPGVNTASLELAAKDFLEIFLPGLGVTPTLITIPDEEETVP